MSAVHANLAPLRQQNPAEDAEKDGRLVKVGNSVTRITATLSAFRGNFGVDNYAD